MSEEGEFAALGPKALRPLRRTEYDQLVEAGAFADERLELLRGSLVSMSPQGVSHSFIVRELHELLLIALRGKAKVLCQMPIALSDDSEPEPDVAVVPLSLDNYAHAHPSKVLLIVEVADSSLWRDARIKARLYAECGVPEFWLFDVESRSVRVHRGPSADGWTTTEEHGAAAALRPLAFPEVEVKVSAVLPPAEKPTL